MHKLIPGVKRLPFPLLRAVRRINRGDSQACAKAVVEALRTYVDEHGGFERDDFNSMPGLQAEFDNGQE